MATASKHPLMKFADKVSSLSREAFEGSYPDPFLLVEQHDELKDRGYATLAGDDTNDLLGTALPDTRKTEGGERYVFSLVKSSNNAFRNIICLGRALNNDIVIHDGAVSKLHALIQHDRARDCHTLADAGSRNGTTWDGRSLLKDTPVDMACGKSMILANSVRATFFMPGDFFEYLEICRRFGTC